jgi:hypothetical protein
MVGNGIEIASSYKMDESQRQYHSRLLASCGQIWLDIFGFGAVSCFCLCCCDVKLSFVKRGRYYHYMTEFDGEALESLSLARTTIKSWAVGNAWESRQANDTRSPTPLPFRAKVADIVNLLWESASAATRKQPRFASSSHAEDQETRYDPLRTAKTSYLAQDYDSNQAKDQVPLPRMTVPELSWAARSPESHFERMMDGSWSAAIHFGDRNLPAFVPKSFGATGV